MSTIDAATKSRALGCVIGSAVGDALGAPYEFGPPDAYSARFPEPVIGGSGEMVPGGPWEAGEATDDTQMGIIEAESILAANGIDEEHLYTWFQRWANDAATKDVGISTRKALQHPGGWRSGAKQVAQSTGKGAGNGSIMRAAPAAVWLALHPDGQALDQDDAAMRLSFITHGDPLAAWGRVALHRMLGAALDGNDPFEVIGDALLAMSLPARERYEAMLAPQWEPEPRQPNGVVWTCLAQAVWAVRTSGSFEEAMRKTIDLGGDTDTVAAVAGGIAGARWGITAIPSRWTAYLHLKIPVGDAGYRSYDLEGLQELTRRLLGKDPAGFTLPTPVGPTEIESGVHAASLTAAATVPKDWGVVSLSRTQGRFDTHDNRRTVFLIDQPAANSDLLRVVTDAVDAVDAFVAEGRNVVVHCHGGHSRTGLILRAWLMRRHEWTEQEATAYLAERWPHLGLWQDEFTEFLQTEWG